MGYNMERLKQPYESNLSHSMQQPIPHQLLYNLKVPDNDYKVIWEFNERVGKWTAGFEEKLS
jgi:hypothetical protein